MNNQEKINYLKQYRSLNMEIDRISEELHRWQDLATRISPSYSDMPHGGGGDKVQTAAVEIAELTDRLNEKIHRAVKMQQEIKELIGTIDDATLRRLMTYRYILGKKWEEIAMLMNYDYRWILRLHGKALYKLDEHAIKSHYNPMILL